MKRIKYRREHTVVVVDEYTADVPEHLLEVEYVGVNGDLDQYVTDNFDPDHEDRVGEVEGTLSHRIFVLGDVKEEQP